MRAVPDEPNVALRPTGDGEAQEVVLAFPYDGHLVAAVRTLPGRRFDWDRREWSAPADGWVAAKLAEILRLPRAVVAPPSSTSGSRRPSSAGSVTCARPATTAAAGSRSTRSPARRRTSCSTARSSSRAAGWCRSRGGGGGAHRAARPASQRRRAPLPRGARVRRTAACGPADPHPRRRRRAASRSRPSGTPRSRGPSSSCPAPRANELKLDAWIVDQLDAFIAMHDVGVDAAAASALAELAGEHRAARRAVAASRATTAEPLTEVAARLGGELAPFQWVAVRYALGRAAPSSQTSRGSARPSRRWRRSRPTMRSRRSSSALPR